MQTAACPGCGANLGVHRLKELRPGYAACNCGAVLGAGADIVVRESDGKAVFDPGAKIETPARFVTTRTDAGTKVGYRDNAAKSERTSVTISFPFQSGGNRRFATQAMLMFFVALIVIPFAATDWTVTRAGVVFAAFSSLAALFFLRLTVAHARNHTTITCADGHLRVRSSPVPLASQDVPIEEIDSIFCQRFPSGEHHEETFAVSARRTSGRSRPLVTHFENLDEALWVVRAVRTALKLEPVAAQADEEAESPPVRPRKKSTAPLSPERPPRR